MNWTGRHTVSIEDFSAEDLLTLLGHAQALARTPQPDLLAGRLMASLFFEPSTRTRLSFEAAACKLGGRV
ncbi:MAG: aspartate carbamoyltransferase, partial [Planctomycetota bacterium]